MDAEKIEKATRDITRYAKALAWLEKYGTNIEDRNSPYGAVNAGVSVSFTGFPAKNCTEAEEIVANYARFILPEAIESAIACCKNTIEISMNVINSELAT